MVADRSDVSAVEDPQSRLEQAFIDEYLRSHGYDRAALAKLTDAQLELLMKQASTYASGRLAEVESRAEYIHDIHGGAEDAHKHPK